MLAYCFIEECFSKLLLPIRIKNCSWNGRRELMAMLLYQFKNEKTH